jgi:hypothetical protein
MGVFDPKIENRYPFWMRFVRRRDDSCARPVSVDELVAFHENTGIHPASVGVLPTKFWHEFDELLPE